MQVQVVEDNTKTFKPFEVRITIETEEEAKALYAMSLWDVSIPDLISSTEQKGIVEKFLNQLRKAIYPAAN